MTATDFPIHRTKFFMDMKRIRPLILIALAALPAGMAAQTQPQDTTLNRTVVVEQEYNPYIKDAAKINAVPAVEAPVVQPKAVEYDNRLQPLADIPADSMVAYAGRQKQPKATPGYLRLGYGNYGNLDIRANYLFRLSSKDRLNLTFSMDGMDGTLDVPGSTNQWDAYYYRTHAAIGYRHNFRRVDMDLAGHFDLSNFNLLPGAADRKQKFTAGDFHLGVTSTADELPLQFQAETNLMFYTRQHEPGGYANAQEIVARTRAHVTGSISDEQTIGVKACMDNVFYHNNAFRDYTAIGLNPYFHFDNGAWQLHLGVHADVAMGFGEKLRVAPDVSAAYRFGRSAVYLQATGGKLQNDFRRLERFSPYGQTTAQLDATYEQLNAAIGLKTGTLGGFHLHLYGGYQNLKDDLYAALPTGGSNILALGTWNTDNLYAGAEISYDYKGLIAFTARGTYRKWSAAKDGADLYVLAFKPMVEAEARMDIHPISPLHVHVGYQATARDEYNGRKADPVSNLYLGGSYELLKHLSVHLRINNLLNKDYQYYPGYPAEGFNFLVGASVRF